jgi:YVTN family beta-propeller protein
MNHGKLCSGRSFSAKWRNQLAACLVSALLCFGIGILSLGFTASGAEPGTKQSGRLLVVNKGDRSLSIIDPDGVRPPARVPMEEVTGHEVAASADGRRAFVPIFGSGGVGGPGTDGRLMRVVDVASAKTVGTIDFGKGVRPHCAVFCPVRNLLYVTTELDHSVTVVDPGSLAIVGRVPTDQADSHMLAITRDGRKGYVSNVGPGTVSVLDLERRKLETVIPVSAKAQRISLSIDDRWVFTADQTQPRLAVITTADNKVSRWITLPGTGYGTAPTREGKWLLVALIGLNQVAVVDLETMSVARAIEVPAAPQEVLVRPDGTEAYVSCDRSGKVAVIDLGTWKVTRLIDVGDGADGLAWAGVK